MTYKRNFILKIYIVLFFIASIIVILNNIFTQEAYKQQSELNRIIDNIEETSKDIVAIKNEIKKVSKKKNIILKYIIRQDPTEALALKFRNLANKSGGIINVINTKVTQTKYINIAMIDVDYSYDRSLIDNAIAYDLLSEYASIIFKTAFSQVKTTSISDGHFSIKVKK
ncbi:hypothetical protein MNB_ARC-1_1138 [hydrothermal vent metagenome]|uniref:Uncharacterized protein n=1 Tax=hydrothermal vent metagenome TaxID=652676 RepID=A0A3B1DYD7_9ZZZZ